MKLMKALSALTVGFINSALGAGGGIAAVYFLKKKGLEQKQAQATALALILPLTVISVAIYLFRGDFEITEGMNYIPFGLAGAICGTRLLKISQNKILKKIFAILTVAAGIKYICP